jgi:hypothetical protein
MHLPLAPYLVQIIYYDISEPWHIGHHSFSENDTPKCMDDIFSLILIM